MKTSMPWTSVTFTVLLTGAIISLLLLTGCTTPGLYGGASFMDRCLESGGSYVDCSNSASRLLSVFAASQTAAPYEPQRMVIIQNDPRITYYPGGYLTHY